MRKARFLKRLDATLGRLLVSLAPRVNEPGICTLVGVRSVLFIRPGGIGDAVLLVPTIRAMAALAPKVKITVLAEKRNEAVFRMCDVVSAIYAYDRLDDLRRILSSQFDVIIDSEQSHFLSALVARTIRSTLSIGFDTNARGKCFNVRVPYWQDMYELESFGQLLDPLGGGDSLCRGPFLNLTEVSRETVRSKLEGIPTERLVVIFPGASIAERRWPWSRFRNLASQLVELGLRVVVIGGRDEKDIGAKISVNLRNVINLTGETSLEETAAIIEASSVLVSGDSGLLHMAVGLSKPAVALFGPGIVGKWAPRGKAYQVLDKGLACSPCTRFGNTPKCKNQVKCLEDIGLSEVLDAVVKTIKEGGVNS